MPFRGCRLVDEVIAGVNCWQLSVAKLPASWVARAARQGIPAQHLHRPSCDVLQVAMPYSRCDPTGISMHLFPGTAYPCCCSWGGGCAFAVTSWPKHAAVPAGILLLRGFHIQAEPHLLLCAGESRALALQPCSPSVPSARAKSIQVLGKNHLKEMTG